MMLARCSYTYININVLNINVPMIVQILRQIFSVTENIMYASDFVCDEKIEKRLIL